MTCSDGKGATPENAGEGCTPLAVNRYMEYIQAHYDFHHNFWSRNNCRFEADKRAFLKDNQLGNNPNPEGLARFYRQYMVNNEADFSRYHRESYQRAFGLLLEESLFLWYQTKHKILGSRTLSKPTALLT